MKGKLYCEILLSEIISRDSLTYMWNETPFPNIIIDKTDTTISASDDTNINDIVSGIAKCFRKKHVKIIPPINSENANYNAMTSVFLLVM